MRWKELLILLVLAGTLIVIHDASFQISGYATGTGTVNILIKNKTTGEFTIFDYLPIIQLYENQNISIEFLNTGTTSYSSRIEVHIHDYQNQTLTALADYYDSTIQLYPGRRRSFKTVFSPPYNGTFYIQARATYANRIKEAWGVFFVLNGTPEIPPGEPNGTTDEEGNVSAQVSTPTRLIIRRETHTPPFESFKIVYSKNITIIQGDTTLAEVNITNYGDTDINPRLFISSPDALNISINPKQIFGLKLQEKSHFLISIGASSDTPIGLYLLNFDVLGYSVKKSGNILVRVLPRHISLRDYLYEKILNYLLITADIEADIEKARYKGLDVSVPAMHLDRAKNNMTIAREAFDNANYNFTMGKLKNVKRNLEDAIFSLAHKTIIFPAKPVGISLFNILLFILMLAVILIIIVVWKHEKKRDKRPRLLQAARSEV